MATAFTPRQTQMLKTLRQMQNANAHKSGASWLRTSVLDAYDARTWSGLFSKGALRWLDCARFKVEA